MEIVIIIIRMNFQGKTFDFHKYNNYCFYLFINDMSFDSMFFCESGSRHADQ